MSNRRNKQAETLPWLWLSPAVVLAVHEVQLTEHGGAVGVRDPGLMASAMARPLHLAAYGTPDVADLAGAYGYGLARNHPFMDGNKRTAFVATELFLVLNGWQLAADDVDCAVTLLGVSAGSISEPNFVQWIRAHSQRLSTTATN